jgi:hypothetical protein
LNSIDHTAPRRSQLRSFGIGFFGILGFIGWLLWSKSNHAAYVLWAMAAGFGVAGIFAPASLGPVYRPWMVFAGKLAWFNTRLLLAITFYLVITPTGLVMRLFGRDPMTRRKGSGSYWIKPPPSARGTKHFKNQF